MGNNRSCWVCGKTYSYCPHCQSIGSWKAIACSPTHYQIYMILTEYRGGVISKEEATAQFTNIGIDEEELNTILDSVARDIKQIITDDSKSKKSIKNK